MSLFMCVIVFMLAATYALSVTFTKAMLYALCLKPTCKPYCVIGPPGMPMENGMTNIVRPELIKKSSYEEINAQKNDLH